MIDMEAFSLIFEIILILLVKYSFFFCCFSQPLAYLLQELTGNIKSQSYF